MITAEKVFDIVRQGPTIPNEIRMKLGEGDTYVIGAVLSELTKSGKVRISNTKKGGSPFYYASGNEHQLESIAKFLNEKDKRTFDKLRTEKVIKDADQDPLTRVSLRQIKDFAKPVEVNTKEGKILFFKYFLVSGAEAEGLIKKNLGVRSKKPEVKKEFLEERRVEQPVNKPFPEIKKEEKHKTIIEEKTIEPATSEFEIKIEKYFGGKGIEVVEKDIVRRQSEIDYIIRIPSPAGKLTYLCKARNKKKFNDKDLSAAFVEGQEKKLPVLFLITGELTKKAEQMLEDKFRNITVNKL